MKNQIEEWKVLEGYENYAVSNFGNVKSLSREIVHQRGVHISKERILKPSKNDQGYLACNLYKNGVRTHKTVHKLVAIAFLGHIPNWYKLVINHKNGIRHDNNIENLEIVTQRENCSICFRALEQTFSSKYVGVSWNKQLNKWRAQININGKTKYIGTFISEIDASNAYKNNLEQIINL